MSISTIQKQGLGIIRINIFYLRSGRRANFQRRFKTDFPIRNEFDNLGEHRKITNYQLQLRQKIGAQF